MNQVNFSDLIIDMLKEKDGNHQEMIETIDNEHDKVQV